jgi:beta-phosphoglucomutase-like phosphatase (HAD superfamily)
VLESLGKRFGKDGVVFFGDAPSDLEAARGAGVHFIGVDGERGGDSPFARTGIPSVRDFTDPGLSFHLEKISVSSADRETHSGSL